MTPTITASEAKRLGIQVEPKTSKYRNTRTVYNGVTYDSKAEADYAKELDAMVVILSCRYQRQVRFELGCPENVYIVDFLVANMDTGRVWCVDVKGKETAKFKRDKKMWRRYGMFPLYVVKRHGEGFRVAERIDPATGA